MANHRMPAPTWLNETYMEDILKSHFNQPELKVQKLDITPGSNEGDNYICLILRIKLQVDINGNQNKMSFIGKLKPNTKLSEVLDCDVDVFALEAYFFEQILPSMKKEMKGTNSIENFAPECFFVDHDKKLIIMEDLAEKNYILQPREEFLNKQQTLLAMEALAVLHGASFKLVEKYPSLKEKFKYSMFGDKPDVFLDKWIDNAIFCLKKNVKSYGMSEDWCKRLLAVGDKLKSGALKICHFQEEHFNVILHGDPWKSNMMFHFTDAIPDDVILLDFQTMTYNSFAHDLHFFLFCSTEADVLVNDLNLLLETYYNTLKEVAPDIPNLTLDRIKKEFANLFFLGWTVSAMFRPFFSAKTPPDMDKLLDGEVVDAGFGDSRFIADLLKLMSIMEKAGVF